MGIVINEELARKTPCTCYQIGKTKEPRDLLCWSSGIIGSLSDADEVLFCPTKVIKPATRELKDRLDRFTSAVRKASERYKGEGITRWLQLVSEEMRKVGLDIGRAKLKKVV